MPQICASLTKHTYEYRGYQQTGLFDPENHPQCSCPAYTYGKLVAPRNGNWYPAGCKHITAIQKNACGWIDGLPYMEAQEEEGICPRCGLDAVDVDE